RAACALSRSILVGAQQSGFAMRLDCFLQSENLAGPIAAHQIQPHIVPDRAVRAWLGEDGGRATLAARLDSCSQPSAELIVLLLETSQSLHTTFFNDKISL